MDDSTSFKIPVARDSGGRLVTPTEAPRRGAFRCPACDALVDLHAGEKKRRHFHHRVSSCTAESVVHLCAKKLVAQAVEDWIAGGPAVTFSRRCAGEGCDVRCNQAIPSKVRAVRLEHRLPSGHVVDVALLARGRGEALLPLPVAAIEVHHTHAVDAAKAREIPIPWIEVDAEQVCGAGARQLVATTDHFLPWLCEDHEGERGAKKKSTQAERTTAAALVRKLAFRLADFPGFVIAGVRRCPRGHDALVFGWEGKEPPWPRPPLVVAVQRDFDWTTRGGMRRPTKTAAFRRTYASACPQCGEVVQQT